MKKILLIIILLFSFNINAGMNGGLGLGPLYSHNNTTEADILGVDLSYTTPILASTASLQPRLFLDKESIDYGIDLQFTLYLYLNIGGGLGYQTVDDSGIVYHLFLGLPIGFLGGLTDYIDIFNTFKTLYLEPYYRYNYYHGNGSHEFGIMIKLNTLTIDFSGMI